MAIRGTYETIKQAIQDVIAPQLQELKGEIAGLRGEMAGLRGEMTGLRGEMTGLRGEMRQLEKRMDEGFAAVRTELGTPTGALTTSWIFGNGSRPWKPDSPRDHDGGSDMFSTRQSVALFAPVLLWLITFALAVRAQPAPEAAATAATESSTQAKIAQLQAAKRGLEREARETNGYHEAFRQMKIIKINKLISRLKSGENVPQSQIDHTINHMPFPLYKAPSD